MTAATAVAAEAITGYWFALTCPLCGGPVDHVADGRPSITRTVAMARCKPCRAPLRIETRVVSVRDEDRSLPRIQDLAVTA